MSGEPVEGVEPTQEPTTRDPATVAVVGTLAEFRPEPVPYDLAELVRFVETIGPDLLCLDMTLDQWQRRDFGGLPPEYRDALLPLASQTDIVVVPVGGGAQVPSPEAGHGAAPASHQGWLHQRLRRAVSRLQRGIDSPVAVGEGFRHTLAESLLHLIDHTEGSRARRRSVAHADALVEQIVQLARRDPGRRILVVVNARHCHQLRRALGACPEVALVHHSGL